jgi:DNA-binding NtrC family response regulator
VLLVDDKPHRRKLLLRALRDRGYSVLDAGDGSSAETLCRASQLEIAALVVRADMKRMCGFELAHRVARMRPEARVLLMWRHFAGRKEAPRAHGRGYGLIEEPFTLDELSRRLWGRRYALIEEPFASEELCHRLARLLGATQRDPDAGNPPIPSEGEVLASGSRESD